MATRNDTSRTRSARNQAKQAAADVGAPDLAGAAEPLAEGPLEQAIEAERAQLLQARAALKCLSEVLLYVDDEDGVPCADVASLAARLIDESVERLDIVNLKPLIEATRRNAPYEYPEEKLDFGGRDQVKDSAAPRYLS